MKQAAYVEICFMIIYFLGIQFLIIRYTDCEINPVEFNRRFRRRRIMQSQKNEKEYKEWECCFTSIYRYDGIVRRSQRAIELRGSNVQ